MKDSWGVTSFYNDNVARDALLEMQMEELEEGWISFPVGVTKEMAEYFKVADPYQLRKHRQRDRWKAACSHHQSICRFGSHSYTAWWQDRRPSRILCSLRDATNFSWTICSYWGLLRPWNYARKSSDRGEAASDANHRDTTEKPLGRGCSLIHVSPKGVRT